MKIKADQLSGYLQRGTAPVYWVAGNEPLLLQEAADQVRLHYRAQGYSEREILDIDKSFNWDVFSHAVSNLGLFSEQKLFDLRLNSAKVEDAGKSALQQYLANPNPDYKLLVSSPKLEPATFNSKWFKPIAAMAVVIQIWPVRPHEFTGWLRQRLRKEGITANPDALNLLADKVEGNLLAAQQEISKLKLLAKTEDENITLEINTVMQLVADSSRYSVYDLVDSALLGDSGKSLKILAVLRSEDTYPLIILGAITRVLRSLLPLLEKIQQGQTPNGVMQSSKIWFNRKAAVGNALGRVKATLVWELLEHARLIDQTIKGLSLADTWDELSLLILKLSGSKTASM
ncbi:MAG: DNA polymerase III subunit delta [Gammaproteobacteria bacterium]|jgi:DNA polymerase-3 subunit delta|nr:DNA polymerase III subunit delta [Gammaproteobacteria bacterium]MDP6095395.1 DNA polymerase III subunit delta [Gammaproteobacteria bacterium]MDP7455736.1 DNA polymerase III subunit delta [Gammaproteobacteria bacterium]|tara:strand:+ start:488 stop:1519 length:1032 start_codon:yes stop_codon:yes gene_type:complete